MTRVCPGCGADMARNGRREIRFVDLIDGRPRRTTSTIARFRCWRCGTCDEADGPRLRPGFRMSEAAFDAVCSLATRMSFPDAASFLGMDPKTIRAAWSEWIDDLEASIPRPASVLLVPYSRRPSIVVALDREGGLSGCFDGAGDRRLGPFLDEIDHILVDPALVVGGMVPPDRAGIRRLDMAEWVRARIPHVIDRCRVWLDRDERRALARLSPIVVVPHAVRSDEMRERMRVGGASTRVLDLDCRVEALRGVWRGPDPIAAVEQLDRWADGLSVFCREAFSVVLRDLETLRPWSFGEDHASFDHAFSPRTPKVPPEEAGETTRRAMGRILAWNRTGCAMVAAGEPAGVRSRKWTTSSP